MTVVKRISVLCACLVAGLLSLSAPSCAAASTTANESTLVIGGSGRTGRLIVQMLHEQGRDVVGMTRNIERAQDNVPGDYAWVQADLTDKAKVEAAIEGKTNIVFAATATAGGKEGNTPYDIDYMGVVRAVDAAKANNVQHFVLISSMNVTVEDHPMNTFLDNMLIRKLEGEDYLRASGLNYTVIRPGGLIDTIKGTQGVMFTQGDIVRGGLIRRSDLVPVIVDALGNEDAYQKTFEVFGFGSSLPPGLDIGGSERPVTFRDLEPDQN